MGLNRIRVFPVTINIKSSDSMRDGGGGGVVLGV